MFIKKVHGVCDIHFCCQYFFIECRAADHDLFYCVRHITDTVIGNQPYQLYWGFLLKQFFCDIFAVAAVSHAVIGRENDFILL